MPKEALKDLDVKEQPEKPQALKPALDVAEELEAEGTVPVFVHWKREMDVIPGEGEYRGKKMLKVQVNGATRLIPCDTRIEVPKAFAEVIQRYTTVS